MRKVRVWARKRNSPKLHGIIGPGEVPEWPNGAVSKTVVALWVTVGSNPTLSAVPRVSAKTVS